MSWKKRAAILLGLRVWIQLQFDCNALHVWPKINKLNYYPLRALSVSVCASIEIKWNVFLLIWPVFIFNCKLRIVYWRFCGERSVCESVCAFICMCVCGCYLLLPFMIPLLRPLCTPQQIVSSFCPLQSFFFLLITRFLFSHSLSFEICEGIFKY